MPPLCAQRRKVLRYALKRLPVKRVGRAVIDIST